MVKDAQEVKGKEFRNRFLRTTAPPTNSRGLNVLEDPETVCGNKSTDDVEIADYAGFVLDDVYQACMRTDTTG